MNYCVVKNCLLYYMTTYICKVESDVIQLVMFFYRQQILINLINAL